MRFLGLELTLKRAMNSVANNRGGWFPFVREGFAGAWQKNVEIRQDDILSYHAVYSCITLISSDIAKLRVKLVEADASGIWSEARGSDRFKVLAKPNKMQTRIQFFESWLLSKLTRGNAYILKGRDASGLVDSMHVLDPSLVQPMIADDGSIYYQLNADNIAGLHEPLLVPAREIIHDRFNCLFHPLMGVSPLYACGLAATQGLHIQENSVRFFSKGATAPGVLTAPGEITNETAERLKAHWEAEYSGADNAGKVAVLGDGLKYERMGMSAVDSQLIDQLKWTAEVVCSVFHVPPYMIGVGQMPPYNNIQALNQQYYSQCLQILIEAAELCLDEGLELEPDTGTEFDLDGLLRMDTATLIEAEAKAVGAGIKSPDEARKRMDLKPVSGGDTPYLQQQNYSLAALAKRDTQENPFSNNARPDLPPPSNDNADELQARAALTAIYKGFSDV